MSPCSSSSLPESTQPLSHITSFNFLIVLTARPIQPTNNNNNQFLQTIVSAPAATVHYHHNLRTLESLHWCFNHHLCNHHWFISVPHLSKTTASHLVVFELNTLVLHHQQRLADCISNLSHEPPIPPAKSYIHIDNKTHNSNWSTINNTESPWIPQQFFTVISSNPIQTHLIFSNLLSIRCFTETLTSPLSLTASINSEPRTIIL